ncbi:MAG: Rrf2 family transcriptional regulator [Brevundimonas sp.]|nr:MAG: Rrf2 family transcriptional regulator [Brevundimonas sp.]
MRLSTKGRYAVMAMADLARNGRGAGGETRAVSLAEIATRQEISLSYLEQLFARLRKGGLVSSVRGPGGGYRLARGAGETMVAEIVLAVDEPIRATRCVAHGTPKGCMLGGERCITHDLWEDLGAEIHAYLAAVSLEDVVLRRTGARRRTLAQGASAAGMEAAA